MKASASLVAIGPEGRKELTRNRESETPAADGNRVVEGSGGSDPRAALRAVAKMTGGDRAACAAAPQANKQGTPPRLVRLVPVFFAVVFVEVAVAVNEVGGGVVVVVLPAFTDA